MLFGIPLGFSGVAVLMGLLAGLASIVAAYYAVAASVLLEGAMFMLMGMIQIVLPQLWDKLMALGFIRLNGPPAELLDQFSPPDQGLIIVVFAGLLAVNGLGMPRLGKRLLRGLHFLFTLAFDWMRRCAKHPAETSSGTNSKEPWRTLDPAATRTGGRF
jgi:hypothetical protein